MKIFVSADKLETISTDALVVPLFEKHLTDNLNLPETIRFTISILIESGDFKCKKFETLFLSTMNQSNKIPRIFLLGLGKKENYNWKILLDAFGSLAKVVKKYPVNKLAIASYEDMVLDSDWSRLGQIIVEGILLGSYKFDLYKKKPEDDDTDSEITELELYHTDGENNRQIKEGVNIGTIIADAVKLTRDLGNQPANIATPTMLAETAESLANGLGLECEVLSKKQLESLNMGALLGVAQGSNQPPKLIVLKYLGGTEKDDPPVIFVGKGVTFDSGGISLKPGKSMDEMKFDMSGGGAVMGILKAVASLKLPLNVIGIIPAVENLPSGHAIKPGDILRSMSGTTIEVLNTDAEGRLILADALTYAEQFNPKYVIDLATLTGSVIVAIGHEAAGIMGNDEELLEEIKKFSLVSGEQIWQFPLYEEYKDQIKSTVADIKNIGNKGAGSSIGGIFLSNFTEKYKWLHLDIAGVAWTTTNLPTANKGATGFGVRLLTEWLRSMNRK